MGEAKILHKEENQGLDYRGEMYENLMQEVNGIQHSPSLISSAYTTHEEGKFPSQLQKNLEFIYQVDVQNGNSFNMLEEKSVMTLENEEQTDQPTPLPLNEK